MKLLSGHRESVTKVANVSETAFASASLDGEVLVWDAESLSCLRSFNRHAQYFDRHTYKYCVRDLRPIGDSVLLACIGSGFAIYDLHTSSARPVVREAKAHAGTVNHLLLTGEGAFASGGADGLVGLWKQEERIAEDRDAFVSTLYASAIEELNASQVDWRFGSVLGPDASTFSLADAE